jgi:hypothetical protein
MPLWQRGNNLEGLTHRNETFALQRTANDVDQRFGQMRQIAQRLVLDLTSFPITAP